MNEIIFKVTNANERLAKAISQFTLRGTEPNQYNFIDGQVDLEQAHKYLGDAINLLGVDLDIDPKSVRRRAVFIRC